MDRVAFADARLFEGFRLDRGGLSRLDQAGVAEPIVLGSRALDLLRLLAGRQWELVSKDAIMEAVWPGTVVEEGNLTVQIAALRRVLDQNREHGSCIQTVPGRGYRFVAPVTRDDKLQGGIASTRRLAAILAADVAGYSRLMSEDEEGTHKRVRAHLGQLVEPKIKEHQGRVVKNTGDGVLAEFASVVDAVGCAVEVQRGMLDREPELPEEQRIRLRIGVNLGDVIAEGGDIFGDGVNVTARLESLAEPGGICISRTVRDQIRDKLPYALEDLGEQSVKNIARPVRVYALHPEGVAELPARSSPIEAPRRRRTVSAAIAAAAVVLIIAIGVWWYWPAAETSTAAATTSISQPLAAPRLSIVVLPFNNLNNDPEQQYFVDALTEDLTTDLSRIGGLLVISRNTAFTYKDKPVNTKQIGRELGVRYVLEGSVRRSGNQLRVNAQLIDAATNAHLWAERFDGDTGYLFALQNEITSWIAIALGQELVIAEAARPTENPDALDFILRGRAVLLKRASRENLEKAIGLFERALAVDPNSIEAQIRLANALMARVIDFSGISPAGDPSSAEADIKRAEELATKAVAALPNSWLAHYAKGQVLRAQRRCAEAIPEYEAALALNRNAVAALGSIGRCKIFIGPIEEAIPAQEQAIRLSPRDPGIAGRYNQIGQAHLLQSRTDEAIRWLEKARGVNNGWHFVHAWLAAAHALKGDSERAAASLAEARRLGPEGEYSSLARHRAGTRFEAPAMNALAEATYRAGLRKAGMPEE